MPISNFSKLALVCLALSAGIMPVASQATVVIEFDEVGPNVVATGRGTLDLTAFGNPDETYSLPVLDPTNGKVTIGATNFLGANLSSYGIRPRSRFVGPIGFGFGDLRLSFGGTGDPIGIDGRHGIITVANTYVSGQYLSGTQTYLNTTLAGLGLQPGHTGWYWYTSTPDSSLPSHFDQFVLQFGPPVPELSTWAMMLLGFCGLGWLAYRRKNSPMMSTE